MTKLLLWFSVVIQSSCVDGKLLSCEHLDKGFLIVGESKRDRKDKPPEVCEDATAEPALHNYHEYPARLKRPMYANYHCAKGAAAVREHNFQETTAKRISQHLAECWIVKPVKAFSDKGISHGFDQIYRGIIRQTR